VIDNTKHARSAWIRQAREVLVHGVAAAQVLADREQQDGQRAVGEGPPAAVRDSGTPLGVGS
jgi:hypothetical protein